MSEYTSKNVWDFLWLKHDCGLTVAWVLTTDIPYTPDIVGTIILNPCVSNTAVVSNSSQNMEESFAEIKVLRAPGIFPFPDDY